MLRLEGKVALVTRASKGIGTGIAKGLVAAGESVAVNYAFDRRGAEAVVAAITASGGQASYHCCSRIGQNYTPMSCW